MAEPCWESIHKLILTRSKPFKAFSRAVKENGMLIIKQTENPDLFTFMCRQVVSQQLSTKSALVIWKRVLLLCDSGLELKDLFSGVHQSKLRRCGLSWRKIRAIQELRISFINDEINVSKVKDSSQTEIKSLVSGFWGFGEWSAEMLLLFYNRNLDIWSWNDSALKRGAAKAFDGSQEDQERAIRLFIPYRSIVSLHVWMALDKKII
ncbi:MAG: hypothetical protein CMK36_04580 [Porticoccaceae bacterium]|nr:hypothetical protein [Porticoccaceae bacterium]